MNILQILFFILLASFPLLNSNLSIHSPMPLTPSPHYHIYADQNILATPVSNIQFISLITSAVISYLNSNLLTHFLFNQNESLNTEPILACRLFRLFTMEHPANISAFNFSCNSQSEEKLISVLKMIFPIYLVGLFVGLQRKIQEISL